jgi:hypothetical protein
MQQLQAMQGAIPPVPPPPPPPPPAPAAEAPAGQQLKGLLWWMRMLGGIKGQELVESVDKRHTSGKVFATIWNV